MLKQTITILAILTLPLAVMAETAKHPLAIETLQAPANLDLGADFLQWGSTNISYSSSWMGGNQYSLGLLTKDLRVPLGANFDFNARFGLAFTPGAGLGADEAATQLVLPYAALDWRPSENTLFHFEFSQGTGNPYRYTPLGAWAADPLTPRRLAREDED